MQTTERPRSLGFWRSWALVVGAMIGSGVFMLPAVLAPYGGLSLAGWLISGGGTLAVALMLGLLARRVVSAGGPYAYCRAAFGDLTSFLIAWGYWLSLGSSIAAIAVGISGYLSAFLPAIDAQPLWGAACTLGLIWLFTGVNILGVREAGIVGLVITVLKLLPLLLVAGAGLFLGDVAGALTPLNPERVALPLLLAQIAMLTMWAYVGVEAATVPSEDVVTPERTIPRALVTGTLTATAVYMVATLGVMALVPAERLANSASPFADAAGLIFGQAGGLLIAFGAVVSIGGTLNAILLLAGQVPRAAALDGLFPQWFAPLNRRGAPARALVASSLIATALILMNYTRGLVGAYEAIILISTLMTLVPYAASALAELKLQRAAPLRAWARPVAALALAFSAFIILGSGLETILYGSVLLLAGLPVYYWLQRRRA